MAFDAGSIRATLRLDRDPFQRDLRAAQVEAKKMDGKTYTAKLDADATAIKKQINDTRIRLRELEDLRTTPRIDADITRADNAIDKLERKLADLRKKPTSPEVDADIDRAEKALKQVRDELDRLQRAKAAPSIDADISAATKALHKVMDELDDLRKQKPSPKVDADISAAERAVDSLKHQLRTLSDQKLKIEADTTQARADVKDLEDQLHRLNNVDVQVAADVDAAQANVRSLEQNLQGLTKKRRTAKVFGDITEVEKKLAVARKVLTDFENKPTKAKVDADTTEVDRKLAQAREKLRELDNLQIRPKVDADIEAGVAHLDQLQRKLEGMKEHRIKVDADTDVAIATMEKAGPKFEWQGELLAEKFMKKFNVKLAKQTQTMMVTWGNMITLFTPPIIAAGDAAFGGLAFVALQHNKIITDSFDKMMKDIYKGLEADASPLIKTATGIMDRLGAEFQRARPMAQDAFGDLNKHLLILTDGFVMFERNAIPAFVRAIHSSEPVIIALRDALRDIGQGIRDFYDTILHTAPQAGEVVSALGKAIEELLGFAGQLGATFMGFASGALPTFVTAMSPVLDALALILKLIEPITPALGTMAGAVTAAWVAWRTFQGIGNILGGLGGRIAQVSLAAGVMTEKMTGSAAAGAAMATAGDRVGGAFRLLGNMMPVIGLAITGLVVAYEEFGTKSDEVSQKVLNNSMTMQEAINTERNQIEKRNFAASLYQDESTAMGEAIKEINPELAKMNEKLTAEDEARKNVNKALNDQLNKMGPLERAQAYVTLRQQEYNDAVDKFGKNSPEATKAQEALSHAVDAAAHAQEAARQATEDHTDALIRQQEQIAGAANADIAYEKSLMRVEKAQAEAAKAVAEHGAASKEAKEAFLDEREAHINVAEAAARKAKEEAEARGETNAGEKATRAFVDELIRQAQTAKGPVRESLLGMIRDLNDTGRGAYDTQIKTANLTDEVKKVPSEVRIPVSAPGLDDTRAKMTGLEEQIRNINGKEVKFYVSGQGADQQVGGIASAGRLAQGGILSPMAKGGVLGPASRAVEYFAGGGHALTPMKGNYAKVVSPNTWRVVGDHMTKRESYIPHDGSPRSTGILSQTANAFGYQLTPAVGMAAGGMTSAQFMTAIRGGGRGSGGGQVDWRAITMYLAKAIEKGLASRSVEHVTVVTPAGASVDQVVDTALFRIRHATQGVYHRTH